LNDDLFIKRMPLVIKELITREAAQNHRSVNQEAIALLEEALLHRVEAQHTHRRNALATLTSYAAQSAAAPNGGPMASASSS
jgi:Arc-like DNA binding domain